MAKALETVLEIDLDALAHNYHYFRSRIAPEVKFMGVVKAYAYGSDSVRMGKELENLGADYLAVAYTEEGVRLRNAGIQAPILVLHPQPVNFGTIIEKDLEPNLYSPRVLHAFINIAEKKALRDYPVHLKFNTGMNRLGFTQKTFEEVRAGLKAFQSIKVVSAFSHLAASEDWKEREFTLGQIQRFRDRAGQLLRELDHRPLFHICNTSAIINYPHAHFDMVRCGLGLYGFANNPETNGALRPVGTLKTVISQIQELAEGESLGYNRSFRSSGITRTATLPLGHADGINRIYGNGKGKVWIHGQPAPIIGNVCMDIIMVDVTQIECSEGDEVIIFGGPGNAADLASAGGSIAYELITGISRRVKRRFLSKEE